MKITLLISLFVTIIGLTGCSKKNNTQKKESSYLYPSSVPRPYAHPKGLKADESDFIAHLSLQNEVPDTVQTHAGGVAYLKISDDSSQIYYTLNLARVDSVTAAQIHYAATAKKGPAVVSLYPRQNTQSATSKPSGPVNGTLKSAMINSKNLEGPFQQKKVIDLIHAIQHDSAYVQVQTKAHPSSDFRGQLKVHHK
jgi:hypothetical protein